MRTTTLYSVLVSCLAVLPVWGAQTEDPKPMLELHSVGLYGWPDAAKDHQVIETVKLLRDRLLDLSEEMDLDPMQGDAMISGWDLLTAKTALRFDANESGMYASMIFEPGDADLDSIYSQLTGFIDMSGMGFDILSPKSGEVMGPMGPIGIEHNDAQLWLSMGGGELVSMDIPRGDLPKGVEPIMSGRLDIARLINTFAPQLVEELDQNSGLAMSPAAMFLGEDAPEIEFNVGVDKKNMHMTSRLIGAAKSMEAMGMGPDVYFEKNDFRKIPEDAVRVSATQINIGSLLDTIETAIEAAGDEEYAQFTEQLGVDLLHDVLGNLGDRLISYQSESTGGGGLLSLVVLVELTDADAFGDAHAKVVDRLNSLAEENIDGYARVQQWDAGGVDAYSITAPGLPIPIEPSWAMSDETLIVALSPGALERAVAQVHSHSGRSVVDNRSFKNAVLSRMPKGRAHAISYYNAARLTKKGYGLTTMLSSALANAARSPKHPDRVLGPIMPDFTSFTKDVAPSSTVSWWDGDDFRTHYIGDESALVQLSVGFGAIADVQGVLVPMFAAGILMPALGQAQERANELMAATQVRSVAQAIIIYSGGNNDQFPDSVETLIDEGIITADILESPFGPAYDGKGDLVIRVGLDFEKHLFDARCVIAIDRALVLNGSEFIPVAFADAHVEAVDIDRLTEILSWPGNEGAAEVFDIEYYLTN